jgi:hypothetical protein
MQHMPESLFHLVAQHWALVVFLLSEVQRSQGSQEPLPEKRAAFSTTSPRKYVWSSSPFCTTKGSVPNGSQEPFSEKRPTFSTTSSRQDVCSFLRSFYTKGFP